MKRTWMLFLAVVLGACGPRLTTPADVTPDPAAATTTQGRFALSFAVERATVRPGDAIVGEARLSLLGPGGATISGSSGLFAFGFTEVGGRGRQVGPAMDAVCAPHRVTSAAPIVLPIIKSGAVLDGPDADWYREFLADPTVYLPVGEWEITASTLFFDGEGCAGGPRFDMRATVRVHVIE